MVSKPSRGSRQTGRNSPAILSSNFWLRATALSGLARTRGLPVGRTASLRSIQESSVTAFIHCCKILEERSGLRLKTRVGSVPSESALRSAKGTGVSAFPYPHYTRTTKAICGSRLETGLWRWAPGPSEHYKLPEGVQADELLEDDNGALLMTTNKSGRFEGHVNGSMEGLKQLVAGKIRDYTLPAIAGQFTPLRLFRSRDGSLWIGTVRGLLHLYQGRIDRFSVADGLSGDLVTSIFEDREGSVWVSTSTGLDRFREFVVPTVSVSQGLSIAAADVLESTPDGSIWIATADGLNRWQDGHMTVYGRQNVAKPNGRTDQRPAIVDARVTEVANSGLRNKVYSLGQDDRGRLWAGSREGVFYFDRGRFVRVPGLPGGDISSIAGDGHGKVWISSLDHGLIYSTPEGAVQRIPWARFGHK